MNKRIIIFLFLLPFLLTQASAAVFQNLGRSPEGLLMGDAFTAVADDAYTLFYNPAALGRHRGVSISPLELNIEAPDVIDKDIGLKGINFGINGKFNDWPKTAAGISDRILGLPLYLRVSTAPSIKLKNFGISLFAMQKTNMILENAVHPSLEVDYRLDRGFIMGYAFNLGRGKTTGKNTNGVMNTLGMSLKSINRQGLTGRYDLFGTNLLGIISNSANYKEIRKNLGFSKGSGVGFDLGHELNIYKGPSRTTFALSFLDIGNTSYDLSEGTVPIPDQKSSLNFGSSFNQKISFIDYTLAFDYHNIISDADFGSKLHFGARLRTPFLRFMAGWNGGYMSFGASFDIYLARLTVGFYGLEAGQRFKQRESERVVVTLNLLEINYSQL